MDAAVDEKILKLRELLLADSSVNIGESGELVREYYETKCECCGYVLEDTEKDGFVIKYVSCPKCAYIQYVPNFKKVPPFWIYKVLDENGEEILDFKGNCRLFEGKEQAEEYIAFCNMIKKWTPIEVERYGDVF